MTALCKENPATDARVRDIITSFAVVVVLGKTVSGAVLLVTCPGPEELLAVTDRGPGIPIIGLSLSTIRPRVFLERHMGFARVARRRSRSGNSGNTCLSSTKPP